MSLRVRHRWPGRCRRGLAGSSSTMKNAARPGKFGGSGASRPIPAVSSQRRRTARSKYANSSGSPDSAPVQPGSSGGPLLMQVGTSLEL
jgi:hypothetical protein